jgi:tRNA pseudouridine38-40 synthase
MSLPIARGPDLTRDGSLIRLRLDLAYDGTDFSGWARQPRRRTVQQALEDALATVLRLPAPPVLTVAGRTDAGVHARHQVAHLDLHLDHLPPGHPQHPGPAAPDVEPLRRWLAGLLPDDVVVSRLAVAPAGFDARFAALSRRYCYRLVDGVPDPLRRRDSLQVRRPLDEVRMHDAARRLLGEHDFAAYARPRPGSTTIRTLRRLEVSRPESSVVEVTAEADAFCHHQVRAMVGALLAVGEGRRDADWPARVLAAGVRDSAVTVVASRGLTLVAVEYPPDDELAARVARTRNVRRRG